MYTNECVDSCPCIGSFFAPLSSTSMYIWMVTVLLSQHTNIDMTSDYRLSHLKIAMNRSTSIKNKIGLRNQSKLINYIF